MATPRLAEQLSPDFHVSESLANADTLHMLSMSHRTAETRARVEGIKQKGENDPYYAFAWQTHYSTEEAATLLDNADELDSLLAVRGTFIVCGFGDPLEYEWVANSEAANGAVAVSDHKDFDLSKAGLLRLDLEEPGIALVWQTENDESRASMGVITGQSIDSTLLREVYDRTVHPDTRPIVDRNLGYLATGLATFMELPFGVCSLETGFSSGD